MNKKIISRRRFIKNVGSIAAGAVAFPYFVPSSALGKAGTVAPSNRITIAFIGLGARGTESLHGFLGSPNAQVIALCDANKGSNLYYAGWTRGLTNAVNIVDENYSNKFGRDGYKIDAYQDFRELISRNDIDAVYVATPDHWHVALSIAAARSGKDVYCEKPMGLTVRQGRALVDAMERYGRVFQMGSQGRSFAYMRKGCELVRNNAIGELKEVRVALPLGVGGNVPIKPEPVPEGFDYEMWLGPALWAPYEQNRCHSRFRYNSDYSTNGSMCDWGAHTIDFAQWGMGMDHSGPIAVEGKGRRLKNGLYDTYVDFDIEYTYANGVKVYASNKGGEHCLFIGTEGWVMLEWGGAQFSASSPQIAKMQLGSDAIRLYESNDHIENFITCIKNRTETVAPAEVGHRAASTCHLGAIAMDLGQKLKWDPEKEVFINNDEANKRLKCPPMRGPWHL